MFQKIKVYLLRTLLGGLVFAVAFLLLSTILDPINTVYNVAATTEKISVDLIEDASGRLVFTDANIYDYFGDTLLADFYGDFEPSNGVLAEFERIGKGPLIMTFSCESCASVGKLRFGDGGGVALVAPDFIEVIIPKPEDIYESGISLVFPFAGGVSLGRSVDFEMPGETTPLLRSGTVTMTGYSTIRKTYFKAGTEELLIGDFLIFDKVKDQVALGFVAVGENDGLDVAYRTKAKTATIVKPGPRQQGSGYPISASLYDRLVSERLFQVISLFFGALIVITTLLTFAMDVRSYQDETKK